MQITGAWCHLLYDWLDQESLVAPALRNRLDTIRPMERVPLAQWQSLLQAAQQLRPQHDSLGLDIGRLVQLRHVGLLGYLVLSCRTLGEALIAYQRYEGLFYGDQLAVVSDRQQQICVSWPADVSTGELGDSVSIVALVQFMRRLVVATANVTRVEFVFAARSVVAVQAFEAFFNCDVRFSSDATRVVFAPELMPLPLQHSDVGLRRMLERQAQAVMDGVPELDAFARRVQQTMVRLLPDNRCRIEVVSRQHYLSVRTLQRRLVIAGTSWQQLLDRTRQALADDYLADSALSLGDIALLLGFSEQSAFSRACKRWSGKTPKQLRRR